MLKQVERVGDVFSNRHIIDGREEGARAAVGQMPERADRDRTVRIFF
jgi:hypothetical protein